MANNGQEISTTYEAETIARYRMSTFLFKMFKRDASNHAHASHPYIKYITYILIVTGVLLVLLKSNNNTILLYKMVIMAKK